MKKSTEWLEDLRNGTGPLSDQEAQAAGVELAFCRRAVEIAKLEARKLIEQAGPVGDWAMVLLAACEQSHEWGLKQLGSVRVSGSREKLNWLAWAPAYVLVRDVLREGKQMPGLLRGHSVRRKAQKIIDNIEEVRRSAQDEIAVIAQIAR